MQKEETKEVLKYQWKKGDKFGTIVEVKESDDKFLYFTDGSKIFHEVASEFLEEIKGEEIPFPGADLIGENIIPDNNSKKEVVVQPKEVKKVVEVEDSPLTQLIKNLSSKNVESFTMDIGINLPKKEIFKMLVDNSEQEESEIIEEISKVASSQIEINNLQEFLTEEIQKYVTNYYKL
jgi:hypothetical protein